MQMLSPKFCQCDCDYLASAPIPLYGHGVLGVAGETGVQRAEPGQRVWGWEIKISPLIIIETCPVYIEMCRPQYFTSQALPALGYWEPFENNRVFWNNSLSHPPKWNFETDRPAEERGIDQFYRSEQTGFEGNYEWRPQQFAIASQDALRHFESNYWTHHSEQIPDVESNVPKKRQEPTVHSENLYTKFEEELAGFDPDTYEVVRRSAVGNKARKVNFRCNVDDCSKIFKRVQNLVMHLRVHFSIKKFECEFCLRRFTQKGNLDKHLKQHLLPNLNDRKSVECPHWSSKFTERYNLLSHLRKKHNGGKSRAIRKAREDLRENR